MRVVFIVGSGRLAPLLGIQCALLNRYEEDIIIYSAHCLVSKIQIKIFYKKNLSKYSYLRLRDIDTQSIDSNTINVVSMCSFDPIIINTRVHIIWLYFSK